MQNSNIADYQHIAKLGIFDISQQKIYKNQYN